MRLALAYEPRGRDPGGLFGRWLTFARPVILGAWLSILGKKAAYRPERPFREPQKRCAPVFPAIRVVGIIGTREVDQFAEACRAVLDHHASAGGSPCDLRGWDEHICWPGRGDCANEPSPSE